jgi:hypothetical protein
MTVVEQLLGIVIADLICGGVAYALGYRIVRKENR